MSSRPDTIPLLRRQLVQHRRELLLAHGEQLVDVLQYETTLVDCHNYDVELVVHAPLDGARVVLVDVDATALLASGAQHT